MHFMVGIKDGEEQKMLHGGEKKPLRSGLKLMMEGFGSPSQREARVSLSPWGLKR